MQTTLIVLSQAVLLLLLSRLVGLTAWSNMLASTIKDILLLTRACKSYHEAAGEEGVRCTVNSCCVEMHYQ